MLRCGKLLAERVRSSDLEADLRRAVERHELQHQFDGASPPMAEVLVRRANERALAVPPRVNRELSAYLAEMSAVGGSPQLTLVRLLRIAAIDANRVDGAAAGLALELLAGHTGPDVPAEAADASFAELADLDDGELRQRARRAWEAELGAALVEPLEATD